MSKKWIRDDKWQRQPHVEDGPPPSLWWYRRPDRHAVIVAYLKQCKRGRAIPDGLKDEIVQSLDELSRLQSKKAWGQPRTYRYWSVPAYALAHRMQAGTLMKRLRELEKLAKQLFPDSVPPSRQSRSPLSDDEKQEIRQLYLAGIDAKNIAQRFRIAPSHVGHLCRKEKKLRAAAREKEGNEILSTGSPLPGTTDDPEHPF